MTGEPMGESPPRPIALTVKRLLDVIASVVVFLLLWWLMLGSAVLIRLMLGSPVFFVQERPGLHGRPFRLWKFRTMRDALDQDGRPLPDADRLTWLGRILRATSVDELPELWNVLIGDMSLVGPRPWLMEYLPHYTAEQMRRHAVRPGITGWAQVNGRNAVSWEERLRLDLWYVDHWSLWLDLRILLRTAWTVVRRDGISATGHATMPRFDERVGSSSDEATTGTTSPPDVSSGATDGTLPGPGKTLGK